MRIIVFFLLLASLAFAKPLVVYTGVYSVSGDKSLSDPTRYVSKFFQLFNGWSQAGALPFDLMVETDAEETKHLAADPISMAILITRDDLQVEHFKTIGVTKTVANLGITVLFYQHRKDENGRSINTILASMPLNSYMVNEKKYDPNTRVDAERNRMKDLLADELIKNRFKSRVANISIEEIPVTVTCNDKGCFVENFKKLGLEVGQSVSLPARNGDTREDQFIKDGTGVLDLDLPTALELKAEGTIKGTASNLKGYSDNTWQVVDVVITSKKANTLFQNEPIKSQFAQWYSDFLSGAGKAVLPPISGAKWTENSMGLTEMVLAREGAEETFVMAPAKNKLVLGISGVANKPIQKTSIEELWAYKIWLTRKINNGPEKEEEYTTSKKVTAGSQEINDVDVFRDLLQVSTKKFAEGKR